MAFIKCIQKLFTLPGYKGVWLFILNFELLKPLITILLFFYLFVPLVGAQRAFTLKIKSLTTDKIIDKIKYNTSFSTDELRQKEINKVLFILYDNAYLAAVIDSVKRDSIHQTIFVTPGSAYQWANLQKGNVSEEILSFVGYREKMYSNKPLYFKEVLALQEKILNYCENNGYPFASIKLDSIHISENTVAAKLALTKNTFIKIDSINVIGNATITSRYLHNYLSLKPKRHYDEQQVKKISTRLKELPFLTETRPLQISFTEKYTKITLYLDKKKASQFDGIVGFLPDSKTGKILFTGDVKLKLQNSFGKGEITELNWRSLQSQTSDLYTHVAVPFLLNTNFGADLTFKLYKKDTTFIEINPILGLQYYLNGGNYFKLFVNNKKLNLITTSGLEFITVLPDYADITTTLYGIGFKSEQLDYRLNPRKGYFLTLSASAGFKNIQKNAKINDALYDAVKLRSTQYTTECLIDYYVPLSNRNIIKMAIKGAQLLSESVFKNELLRIGGLRNLRGFDEESILATAYGIFSLEYRYLLERNSYLYAFGDAAYYENNSLKNYIHDTPYGFGAGISFETKAGIFSINYALGKQFNNPILLRSGKVHFGIVNYF